MKNIVLRDEVYNKLSKMKRGGESFSDVILRLLEEKREKSLETLERYAGSLAESDLFEIVMKERKSFEVRDFDL
jgi:predicted CopG family antitoxin